MKALLGNRTIDMSVIVLRMGFELKFDSLPYLGVQKSGLHANSWVSLIIDELIAILLFQDFKWSKSLIWMNFNYVDVRQNKLKQPNRQIGAGRGIWTPAAPRGHKLLGVCIWQASPGLLPAWLGYPGNRNRRCHTLICNLSLSQAEFKVLWSWECLILVTENLSCGVPLCGPKKQVKT